MSTFFASYRTRIFAAALWSNFNAMVKKKKIPLKLRKYASNACNILGQVWYLIVSIPDLCPLSYFENVSAPPQYILRD